MSNFQGKIEIQGSPSDLARSGVNFAKLVGIEETEEDEGISENPEQPSSRKTSISSTSTGKTSNSGSKEFNENDEQKDEGVQMEESSKGKVKGSVSASYFAAGAHWSVLIVLGFTFVFVQILASGADYWVSVW